MPSNAKQSIVENSKKQNSIAYGATGIKEDVEAACVKSSEQAPKESAVGRLDSLDFVRFFAAVHILGFHNGMGNFANFFSWGDTWVPFFFILSGFVLTYSSLRKPGSEEMGFLMFLRKRLASTYPVYIIGMLWMLDKHVHRKEDLATPLWDATLNVFMVQVWKPWHEAQMINLPSWFMSALFGCWIFWYIAFPKVQKANSDGLRVILASALLFTTFKMFAIETPLFFRPDKSVGQLAKTHPLLQIDFFLYGMWLAKHFFKQATIDGAHTEPLTLTIRGKSYRFSASFAFTFLVLFYAFCSSSDHPLLHERCLIGMLAPIQMLLIWGLACGEDPLAQLLGLRPLAWFGCIAYPLYLLQFPVTGTFLNRWREWYPAMPPQQEFIMCVLPANVLLAIFAHYLVEKPYAQYYR